MTGKEIRQIQMENKISREIMVGPSMCDSKARMTFTACVNLFMDMATVHAEMIGNGPTVLTPKGLFWITAKTRIRILRAPLLTETVTVSTWPEKPGAFKGDRDYEITSGDSILVLGKTEWCVIDFGTKRPARVKSVYPEGMEYLDDVSIPEGFEKINDTFEADPYATHKVDSSDIDIGGHMNNGAYVRALMSTFSVKELNDLKPTSLEIVYLESCYEGDILYFRREITENGINIRMDLRNGRTAALAKLS